LIEIDEDVVCQPLAHGQQAEGQVSGVDRGLVHSQGFKTHVSSILTQLGRRTRVQAAILAYEARLLENS
jgi:hypothetical protein